MKMTKTSLVVKGTGSVSELRDLIKLLKQHYVIVNESNFRSNRDTGDYHVFLDLAKKEDMQ